MGAPLRRAQDPPILCLVTDRASARRPLAEAVAAAVAAGVDWIQVRDRELGGAGLLEHVESLARAARTARRAPGAAAPVRVLVNRRLDVAWAAKAHGVHLGFDAMAPETARALLGPDALVGAATHGAAEVEERAAEGACSHVHLAPVYPPVSKAASRPPLGPESLRRACAAGLPVLAQGGIDPERAAACVAAGAAGVAVTGAILASEDPGAAAAALRRALDEAVR